ncbi:MAG TPA: hypothetical protein VGD47_04855 [Steroidobacteraceae bacterium]
MGHLLDQLARAPYVPMPMLQPRAASGNCGGGEDAPTAFPQRLMECATRAATG